MATWAIENTSQDLGLTRWLSNQAALEQKGTAMLPYVILHMGIGVDGRVDWGGGSDNPCYELVEQFGAEEFCRSIGWAAIN